MRIGDRFPAKSGGVLTIESERDGFGRCRFVIEWEDDVAHCASCGLRPGEGFPATSEGPTCDAKRLGVVCGGPRTKKRAQQFNVVPEEYIRA